MNLIDIHRVLHPATAQNTIFSATHGTFSKIDHILDHKASLNKCKKIEITPCILSEHNIIKLELTTTTTNKSRKYSNTWRMNNTLIHDPWVTKEIREEIKKFLEFNENKSTT
jgi:hypothetical protein